MEKYLKIFLLIFLIGLLQSCAAPNKKPKSVHGDKPLIDTAEIIVQGREDMDKKVIDGPKPYDTTEEKKEKRKTTTTKNVKNYITISDDFSQIKQ